MSKKKLAKIFTLICVAPSIFGQTWNFDGDSAWSVAGRWTPATVPNAPGAIATFGNVITAPRDIQISSLTKIGTLNIDSGINYTIISNNNIDLSLESSVGNSYITITNVNGNGSHTIDARITISDPLIISQGSTGTLTLSGTIRIFSGTIVENNLTVIGPGDVIFSDSMDSRVGFTMNGSGTVRLTGVANTSTTPFVVNSGQVILNKTGASILGSASVTGGTLTVNAANQINQNTTRVFNVTGGTFNLGGNSGTIGRLNFMGGTISGTGTLTLNNTATALTIFGGRSLAPNLRLSGSGDVVFDAANLGSATLSQSVDLGGGPVTFNIAAGSTPIDMTVNGPISNGALVKTGSGVLALQGVNTYIGGTTVTAGTLQGSSSGLQGDITNNSVVTFIENATGSYSGLLSGNGTLNFRGTGTITLSGATNNTYTGITNISSGSVFLNRSGVIAINGNVLQTGGLVELQTNGQFNPSQTIYTLQGGTLNLNNFTTTMNALNCTGGLVSGSGILELSSAAALTVNTGTINTAVHLTGSGAPQIMQNTNGSVTISNLETVAAGATPTFILAGTVALQSSASNGAGFIKQGTGNLRLLSGVHDYTGGASEVQAGLLSVLGDLTTSTLDIASGATLNGIGVITGDVNVAGILQPGQSIGTINIVGSQTFASGSSYEVELNATASDLLIVSGAPGTVVINPGATLSLFPSSGTIFPNNSTFTLISTTGGLTGQFSNVVVANAAILTSLSLTYTATELLLQTSNASFSSVVTGSSNPAQVAQALDQMTPKPGSDLASVYAALQSLMTVAELTDALDVMQPSMLKGLAIAEENMAVRSGMLISQRIDQIITRTCGKSRPVHGEFSLWSNVLGDGMHQQTRGLEPGFQANTGGIAIGADYLDPSQFFGGVALNYDYTKVSWQEHRGSGSINSGIFSVYGGWYGAMFFADLVLQGAFNHYQEKRNVIFGSIDRRAHGNFNGGQFLGALELGMLYSALSIEFKPYIASEIIYLHQQAFRETGAASLDLSVASSNYTFVRSSVGIGLSHCFPMKNYDARLGGTLAYIREDRLQGKRYKASLYGTEPYFIVQGLSPDRNLFGAGLSLALLSKDQRYQVVLDYETEVGAHYWDQNGRMLFGYRF